MATYHPQMSDQIPSDLTTMDTSTMRSGGAHINRRISWAAIFGGVENPCNHRRW